MTERSVSKTRNSGIREMAAPLTEGIAKIIVDHTPITADHLNIAGAIATTTGTITAASRNPENPLQDIGKTIVSTTCTALAAAADGVDGAVAREMESRNPGSIDFEKGQRKDALGDRSGEVAPALGRMVLAHRGRNRWGELAAAGVALTSTLPSIARAYAETKGKAVLETGRGILGLIGTRFGRATLGVISTNFPKVGEIPVQPILDTISTISNVVTTVDRLRAARHTEPTLPEQTRKEARSRLRDLGIFGIASIGAVGLTSWILNRKPKERSGLSTEDAIYVDVMHMVERYCTEHVLNHRIVGGTLTNLIGPETGYVVDPGNKRIKLISPNRPTLRRSDNTVKDMDVVAFTPDQDKLEAAKATFRTWAKEAKRAGIQFPNISIEGAWYPDGPNRNKLKQLVSAFAIDKLGQPHLVFGNIDQPIDPRSIDPWTVDTGYGQITTLHPVAHDLCYRLRVPSGLKKKDREIMGRDQNGKPYSKMTLLRNFAARTTLAEEKKLGINNTTGLFDSWLEYIDALHSSSDTLTRVKARITGLYWDTIGTQVSHGAGPFGWLSTLSDRMNG